MAGGRASLTVHAVQTEDEADEVLQWHVTSGGAVTQNHQTEHVVAQHISWSDTRSGQESCLGTQAIFTLH